MFETALEAAFAALAAVITVAAPILIPPLRRWIIAKAKLDDVIGDGQLAERLDKGAINIIENALEELRNRRGSKPVTDGDLLAIAQPRVKAQFPQTLEKLHMQDPQVREFVKARVRQLNARYSDGHH